MRQNNLTKLVNKEELLKKTKMYSDSNDEVKGFHDNDTNDIYINLDNANDTDDNFKKKTGNVWLKIGLIKIIKYLLW